MSDETGGMGCTGMSFARDSFTRAVFAGIGWEKNRMTGSGRFSRARREVPDPALIGSDRVAYPLLRRTPREAIPESRHFLHLRCVTLVSPS